MEKEKHLPVSFLCDRETTKVAQSQPGFLGFVVLPLYRSMIEVIPQAKILVDQLEMNADEWKNYEETVKDRRVYIKPKQKSVNLLRNLSKMESYTSDGVTTQEAVKSVVQQSDDTSIELKDSKSISLKHS